MFLLCLAAAIQVIAVELPLPSGSSAVGTTVLHLTDHSRPDPVRPELKREVMVQCWYPIIPSGRPKAAYFPDGRLLSDLALDGYYGQSAEQLESWRSLSTHAELDASIKSGRPLPILLLLPGLGIARSNYTIFCEDLASHDYFVAAIDPPYGGETILPNGRRLSANDDAANGDPKQLAAKVREWALDARFVLDQLSELDRKDSKSKFAGKLSVQRVGAFGHSMGGSAAFDATLLDSRFIAAADLDGAPTGESVTKGLTVTTLRMRSDPNYSDADLAKLGRTRQRWEEMGREGSELWATLARNAKASYYTVSIRDTGHLSYSDAPYVMPSTITRFSNHSLPADQTQTTTLRYLRAFFDMALRKKGAGLFAEGARPLDGVTITRPDKVGSLRR
jgi:pimeloyl-ACP methyl ester carboxylesterase